MCIRDRFMLQAKCSTRIPNVAPKDLITLRYNAKSASLSFIRLSSVRTNPYFINIQEHEQAAPSASAQDTFMPIMNLQRVQCTQSTKTMDPSVGGNSKLLSYCHIVSHCWGKFVFAFAVQKSSNNSLLFCFATHQHTTTTQNWLQPYLPSSKLMIQLEVPLRWLLPFGSRNLGWEGVMFADSVHHVVILPTPCRRV